MPRVLSVARAQVPEAREPEYLALLGELATRLRSRGQSLWLFRHPEQRDTFLEFSESASAELHRTRAPRDAQDAALEARLRALAVYAADAAVLWEAVSLGES